MSERSSRPDNTRTYTTPDPAGDPGTGEKAMLFSEGRHHMYRLDFYDPDNPDQASDKAEFICRNVVRIAPTTFRVIARRIAHGGAIYGETRKSSRVHMRTWEYDAGELVLEITTILEPASYQELVDLRDAVRRVSTAGS